MGIALAVYISFSSLLTCFTPLLFLFLSLSLSLLSMAAPHLAHPAPADSFTAVGAAVRTARQVWFSFFMNEELRGRLTSLDVLERPQTAISRGDFPPANWANSLYWWNPNVPWRPFTPVVPAAADLAIDWLRAPDWDRYFIRVSEVHAGVRLDEPFRASINRSIQYVQDAAHLMEPFRPLCPIPLPPPETPGTVAEYVMGNDRATLKRILYAVWLKTLDTLGYLAFLNFSTRFQQPLYEFSRSAEGHSFVTLMLSTFPRRGVVFDATRVTEAEVYAIKCCCGAHAPFAFPWDRVLQTELVHRQLSPFRYGFLALTNDAEAREWVGLEVPLPGPPATQGSPDPTSPSSVTISEADAAVGAGTSNDALEASADGRMAESDTWAAVGE